MIREIHKYKGRFGSLSEMKSKLMDEFPAQVPSTMDFQLGYFIGKQSSKYWLMCQDDLESMYKTLQGRTSVLLWCDGRPTDISDEEPQSRKRKNSSPVSNPTKRKELDIDLDDTVRKLREKHGSTYSLPQMRLWARMIAAGHHESTDNPPQIPAITGITPKREKKTSLSSALAGAAVSFASALRSPGTNANASSVVINAESPKNASEKPLQIGLSPGRVTEIRSKKLRELRELQQLLEDNILSTAEFTEQKELVLNSLRKLTH